MAKNVPGEGQVRKHSHRDLYEGRYSFIDPETGTRKYGSVYAKTDKEALKALRETQARIEQGKPAKDSRQTVASWLDEWRDGTLLISDRGPTTKELYRSLAKTHLIPAPFGNQELATLRPSHIQVLLHKLHAQGLAPSTVRNIYAVLNSALEDARLDGLIAHNPMRDVKRPSAGQTEAKHLTTQETLTLLAAAEGMRYKMAFELMAVTGMRRGETLALTWDNIDLEKGTVKVRATLSRVDGKLIVGSPKTAKSHRDIPLTENMVLALKQHRKGQVAEQLKAGSQWQNKGLVFSTELGGYVDPRNLLRGLNIAARKAGLEGIGLHTLRHSAATAMLEANTPILNVSRMLGHSSIAITIDLYGHVNDESMRQAINGLSKALGF